MFRKFRIPQHIVGKNKAPFPQYSHRFAKICRIVGFIGIDKDHVNGFIRQRLKIIDGLAQPQPYLGAVGISGEECLGDVGTGGIMFDSQHPAFGGKRLGHGQGGVAGKSADINNISGPSEGNDQLQEAPFDPAGEHAGIAGFIERVVFNFLKQW